MMEGGFSVESTKHLGTQLGDSGVNSDAAKSNTIEVNGDWFVKHHF